MIILIIFISFWLGINIRVHIVLGILLSILLVGFCLYRFNKKMGLLSLGLILLGLGVSFIRPSYNEESRIVLVCEVKDNYYLVNDRLEKLYIYEKDHQHEIGDFLYINGKKTELSFSVTESSFDFKNYLNNKGVYYQFNISKIEVKFSNPIRLNLIKKNFLSKFDDDTASMIRSILFGSSDNSETTDLFRSLHLVRLVSSSGIYLSIFYFIFSFLLSYIFKKEKYVHLVSTLLLLLYSVLTFPRFVVIKFVFIKILRWINDYPLKKKFNYLEIISFSVIFFLLFDYHLGYQDSFLLSYLIPLFTYFLNNSLKWMKSFKKKIALTIGIILLFVPFSVSYYHELSPFSYLIQLLLTPFLIIYDLMSLLSFFGIPLYQGLNGYTAFIKNLLLFISHHTFSIYVSPLNDVGIFIYEAIYLVFIYFFSIRFADVYKIIVSISLSIGVIYIAPISPLIISSVSFINVGQGDSCLIHSGTTSILIDTGGNIYNDLATSSLIPYFKKMQIYDIDLLITTHNDFDHNGAAASLISNFKVHKYVTNYQAFPIKIGNITLTNYNVYSNLWNEDNDMSLFIGFTLKGDKYLITGDTPKKIEKQIIKDHPDLDCDILKVGHHGSNTSSDDLFIKTISPKEAIISCGLNNKYHHPHQETINVLNKYHVKIRRTDLEGTIKYYYIF